MILRSFYRCANEVNPDEGIETLRGCMKRHGYDSANEVNPDEGIETLTTFEDRVTLWSANEVNPDEGIETGAAPAKTRWSAVRTK